MINTKSVYINNQNIIHSKITTLIIDKESKIGIKWL